jgi:hypothetical protein
MEVDEVGKHERAVQDLRAARGEMNRLASRVRDLEAAYELACEIIVELLACDEPVSST